MAVLPHLLFFALVKILIFHGNSEVIYEEGYTVTTVFDGNKLKINPHSVVSRPNFHDLLLLDSTNSVFYTLSLPLSQESLVKKFSGNKVSGKKVFKYSDGGASSATFDKPRSFAIDFKGNVYVAEKKNRVVRKISQSGVTTIAGDDSNKRGHDDGPGRNATFSPEYGISFVPELCALLIMDHGNQLIRQINLKQEDCVYPRSGGVNTTSIWFVAIGVSCLVGAIIGFAIRPFIVRTEVFKIIGSKSWMTYLMNLGRQAQTCCFGTRNAAVSQALRFLTQLIMLSCSHLSLMLSLRPKRNKSSPSSVRNEYVSLLDSSDNSSSSSECVLYQKYADQLKELTTSNGDLASFHMTNDTLEHEDVVATNGNIDTLVKANLERFGEDAPEVVKEAFLGVSTVVKRR